MLNRRNITLAFAALGSLFFAEIAVGQVPLIKGSLFGKLSATFTTGERPFHDATGAYTFGTKQPLAWATSSSGVDYPVSQAVIALSQTHIGATEEEGAAPGNATESLDLGVEGQIWLGLWDDLRLSYMGGAEAELDNPNGAEKTKVGLSFGLVKNLSWNNNTRSGFVVGVDYMTLSRGAVPYANLQLTLGYYLPGSSQ